MSYGAMRHSAIIRRRCTPGSPITLRTSSDGSGFSQAGYFETVIGDGPELTYLLRWNSFNERQEAWDRFHADPEWQEVRRTTTEAHGLLVARTHSSILRPLPFSELP